jgi:methionyl aminopeptidase
MSIETPEDLAGMEQAGKVTRAVLNAMKAAVHSGITTGELDEIGASTMRDHGARSAPKQVYRFPGHSCMSVNDEVVHGVPGTRRLEDGDLVKLDVTVEVEGYMTDACETVGVGSIREESKRLVDCASCAFWAGVSAARVGARAFEIGKEVHKVVSAAGYFVVRDLGGHGIGKTIHESPRIPNDLDRCCADLLRKDMVFTIEPIIAMGTPKTVILKDGWTVRTRDRSRSAHYEHTVLMTDDGARLLTA